ncbi:Arylsulfatase [Planctomycetes bacterium CA13]|uniref:Arylsulfatase n=2 Tax=Novipirellula herctigrandis TaxID=2527986 RepID=A0A5C5Z233_9BACT|nr:Arylsulfatase [Planctomycetes bacterium CA13]
MMVLLAVPGQAQQDYNVLLIMSDDLTAEALGCYGNTVCLTPNIDALAAGGTRYTRAYCQYPVCGPSRSSMMFSYYPHTTGVFGYVSGRSENGDRESWTQYFRNRGYYAARVSKIFHMGVPRNIQAGGNGEDDALSWTERFNSQGPEAEDAIPLDSALNGGNPTAERLAGIKEGDSGVNQIIGGNTYEYVIVPNDDTDQSDGKSAVKACELLELHKNERFILAVGFVRPHIPFVAPKQYFDLYPWQKMVPPTVSAGDQDDVIHKYVTTSRLKFNETEKKKSIAGYYASVTYMDAQVGKVLQKLEDEGLAENTIVIFASDHGFFLGEHDFWSKQYVHEESARVPLIIKVPGKVPAVCGSFAELVDLFPTTAELCGLPVPTRLQGKSLATTLDDPTATVRDAAFTVMGSNTLYCLRSADYAFIQKSATGSGGYELYDMLNDPFQYTNLASNPAYATVLDEFKISMAANLASVVGYNDSRTTFTGGTGTDYNNANNWDKGAPAAEVVDRPTSPRNDAIINDGKIVTTTASLSSQYYDVNLGFDGTPGTLNLATSWKAQSSGPDMGIRVGVGAGSVGTLNLQSGANLTLSGAGNHDLYVGDAAGGLGTVNILAGSTMNTRDAVYVVNGTISFDRAATFLSGNAVGKLEVGNNGVLSFDTDGANVFTLPVTNATLGGTSTLQMNLGGTFTSGDTWLIASGISRLTGTFGTVEDPSDPTLEFIVHYGTGLADADEIVVELTDGGPSDPDHDPDGDAVQTGIE